MGTAGTDGTAIKSRDEVHRVCLVPTCVNPLQPLQKQNSSTRHHHSGIFFASPLIYLVPDFFAPKTTFPSLPSVCTFPIRINSTDCQSRRLASTLMPVGGSSADSGPAKNSRAVPGAAQSASACHAASTNLPTGVSSSRKIVDEDCSAERVEGSRSVTLDSRAPSFSKWPSTGVKFFNVARTSRGGREGMLRTRTIPRFSRLGPQRKFAVLF